MTIAIGVAALCGLSALAPVTARSAPLASPCLGQHQARPGTVTVPVASQGKTYPVLVHIPPRYDARQPLALLFNLHGSTQSGARHEASTGTDQTADAHGFLVAYPDGGVPTTAVPLPLPAGYFWNVPGVPLVGGVPVPPGSRNDVRFIGDAIGAIAHHLCVDTTRVYATGASGGGRMASVLACAMSNRIAAVAPVMGVRAGNPDPHDNTRPDPATCAPTRPMPVVAFHGEKDTVDPYGNGGEAYWGYSVQTAMARWAQIDGCRDPRVSIRITATVTLDRWSGCLGGVELRLYRSSIGGHTWPGRQESAFPGTGAVDMSISANEVMWSFMKDDRSPPAAAGATRSP